MKTKLSERASRRYSNIDINDLREYINNKLSSPFISQDVKFVLCNTLEEILMNTRNYAGFEFLNDKEKYTRKYG